MNFTSYPLHIIFVCCLSVMSPNCDPDGDEAEETHSGKTEKSNAQRNRYIQQPETGNKRQEQHCGYNEFPTLQPFGCLFDQDRFIHCVLYSRRLSGR